MPETHPPKIVEKPNEAYDEKFIEKALSCGIKKEQLFWQPEYLKLALEMKFEALLEEFGNLDLLTLASAVENLHEIDEKTKIIIKRLADLQKIFSIMTQKGK